MTHQTSDTPAPYDAEPVCPFCEGRLHVSGPGDMYKCRNKNCAKYSFGYIPKEYVDEITTLHRRVAALEAGLERIKAKTCGCMSARDDNWHGDGCWKKIAIDALLPATPRKPETGEHEHDFTNSLHCPTCGKSQF